MLASQLISSHSMPRITILLSMIISWKSSSSSPTNSNLEKMKSIQKVMRNAEDIGGGTFEDLLPAEMVVLGLDVVLTGLDVVRAFLSNSYTELFKYCLQLLSQQIRFLYRINQTRISLSNLQLKLQNLIMTFKFFLNYKHNLRLWISIRFLLIISTFPQNNPNNSHKHHEPHPQHHYIFLYRILYIQIKVKVLCYRLLIFQHLNLGQRLIGMIVTDTMERIEGILGNMRMAHSRIMTSFRIQAGRAIRQEGRISVYNEVDNNRSFKHSKDSTLAESKEPAENQQNNEKQSAEFNEPLNQIVQQSMDENQSYQQINPLRNFISPNNWFITNSRNQQKSAFDMDIDHEPQCASFRHIEQVQLP